MKINQETHNPATAMQKAFRFLKTRTKRMLLTACAGLVLSMISPAQAAAPDMMTLHEKVSAVVSHLQAIGDVPGDTNLSLAIGLPLRNREALTNLLAQIYDPASTNYHHYLTPEQFTERFGPTEQDYAMVANFARVNGLTITGTHPNRMLLDVKGKASDIEKAFHTTLKTYRHPKENRDFFASEVEPTVTATLPILHISGLENYYTASPRLRAESLRQTAGAKPNFGSAPGGFYQGKDFRNAYVPGTTLTGAGQNVALFQLDGFYASDITAYANQIGLTNPPQLVTVPVDGGVQTPTLFGNPEVSLDIEMVLSMSPGVSNIYVYEGPNSSSLSIYTIFEDVLSQMANDNLAKQIGCSWFIVNGGPDPVAEQIFQQMALQGQTFFCASGDSDAYSGLIPFPSDSPHITLVGGTTLTTGPDASYTSEAVWNYTQFGLDGEGSSGGISTTYPIPSWQTNINVISSHGSATMRNVPDVAMTGDDVWIIYGGGLSQAEAGTSCAAPLWAGFAALINQQASSNGHEPIGFINPALYAIASGTNYTNCFHDVIKGDNAWSGSPNLFYATNNYDLATGLGTPNGTNLINALTAVGVTNPIVHITPPPPPYGSTLANLNGGNPNGTWQLFVQDDTAFNSGIISNGWILTLTTANPVGFSSDLELTMDASAPTITLSNLVTYTLTVTNYGPSISSNVLVADKLPVGVIVVSSTISQGSLTGLNWNVGTLAIGAGARMVLTVQPLAVGSLLNYAAATAATPDANSDNDFASTTVDVIIPAPPQLSGAYVGGNGAFQFTVTSDPGVTNIIQASTNLTTWIPIYTNIGSFIYTNLDATNYPQRFYRTLMLP